MRVPKRKPKGRDLPPRHKAGDRQPSRQRIVNEHAIGKMTIWRITSDHYGGARRRHALVLKNVAGLHKLMSA